MILKIRNKAGILLYAILMFAVFSLFLQFYLARSLAGQKQSQALTSASIAHLMAERTREAATDKAGQMTFNHGTADYRTEKEQLQVEVTLKNGKHYAYQFLIPEEVTTKMSDASSDIKITTQSTQTQAQTSQKD